MCVCVCLVGCVVIGRSGRGGVVFLGGFEICCCCCFVLFFIKIFPTSLNKHVLSSSLKKVHCNRSLLKGAFYNMVKHTAKKRSLQL